MQRIRPGQALVVMLLIMGVAVTVGLSIASRSITQVAISTTEDEANKALEAAEAGVEKALGGILVAEGTSGTLPQTGATYNVRPTGVVGLGSEYEVPYPLESGDMATINLEGFTDTNNFRVCWSRGSNIATSPPAVEVMVYYRDLGGNVGVGRNGYDPRPAASGGPRAGFRSMSPAACGSLNAKYQYRSAFTLLDGAGSGLGMPTGAVPLLLRVRVLYNVAPILVAVVYPGRSLPVQGADITSVGRSGDSVQSLRVTQLAPDYQPIFDAAVFSGGDLVL